MVALGLSQTPHVYLYTCISFLLELKVDQTIIKKIVGHFEKMMLTEKLYSHFDVEELVTSINKMKTQKSSDVFLQKRKTSLDFKILLSQMRDIKVQRLSL